ncbi:envelope glycoprotein N [Aotine betaherpesvirus 1]|uniref:Envelope glycoprotein N n=1 Tax=Aotine betaherpesvirus 1 TaxID=50290 RepID=G8XUD8_9BETA|nr:envelope glycoprotein N [Aotine betaherpesvirus 1]AEV80768.1 envelope glycoprotein N [Aotine betaherpesvirus 1]
MWFRQKFLLVALALALVLVQESRGNTTAAASSSSSTSNASSVSSVSSASSETSSALSTSKTTLSIVPTSPKATSKPTFYDVTCTSHTYELSMHSFAAIWMCVNVVILLCSFGVVLKHFCFQTFTISTTKGY